MGTEISWSSSDEELGGLAQARCLPRRAYVDQSVAEAERATVFRRHWVAVGVAGQIPDTGSYFTTEVAGQPLLVVRGGNGDVAAFYNTCMHRGTLLCTGAGRVDEFICPNHGWRYGVDGQLDYAPWFERVQGFDRREAALVPVRITVWQGVVFVNLSGDAPGLDELVPEVPSELVGYGVSTLRCVRSTDYEFPGNWKLVAENLAEAYHIPFVHGPLGDDLRLDGFVYGETTDPLSTWYYVERRGAEDLSVLGDSGNRAPLPALDREGKKRLRLWRVFPNVQFLCSPDHVVVLVIVPRGVDRSIVRAHILLAPGETAHEDIHEPLDRAMFEDAWIVGRMQDGLAAEAFISGRIQVPTENNVFHFHRQIRKELEYVGVSLE